MSDKLGSKLNKKPIFRAHNPKAVGSNPAPATKENQALTDILRKSLFFFPTLFPTLE